MNPKQEQLKWEADVVERETEIALEKIKKEHDLQMQKLWGRKHHYPQATLTK